MCLFQFGRYSLYYYLDDDIINKIPESSITFDDMTQIYNNIA